MEELLKEMMGPEWFNLLKEDFSTPWFLEMAGKVANERATKRIYPNSEDVFRAFKLTPPDKVKVIMLGQDPYNGIQGGVVEATGIAFDFHRLSNSYVPPSWTKVMEEYNKEFPTSFAPDLMDGDLSRWCANGVLLINTALTVPHKSPGAHKKIWQPFIAKVIDKLSWDSNPKVFVFLGNDAQAFMHIVRQPHIAVKYEHPAAACYASPTRNWNAPFIFTNINLALKQLGQQSIDW